MRATLDGQVGVALGSGRLGIQKLSSLQTYLTRLIDFPRVVTLKCYARS